MFLRRYRRNKDGKIHTYFALVESVRTDAGPRQHVVAYLGELNHDQERRWQRTVVFYNRHGDARQLRLFPEDDDVALPDDPDGVAIEVINRLCGPCSEFALAEHWYASTALEDLLGVPDQTVTKDRLYRTLTALRSVQNPIENGLKENFGTLFQLDYDVLLYDLTSSYFEGLAEHRVTPARSPGR